MVGLIGEDILGSLSPSLHEREAEFLGLRYTYLTFDLRELHLAADTVGDLVDAARRLGFTGLNVTHPCKQLVIEHLDELTREAEIMKAVNTVVFQDGAAIGHNTDWSGFGESLRRFLPGAARREVVVLGAGGAGSAAAFALLSGDASHVTIVDLVRDRAEALADALGAEFGKERIAAAGANALGICLAEADGVVQATPIGMAPRGGLPFEIGLLRPALWVYDIVYRPRETELLQQARALGCRTLSGGAMAVFQAAEALRLFTSAEPDAERMLGHLLALEEAEG